MLFDQFDALQIARAQLQVAVARAVAASTSNAVVSTFSASSASRNSLVFGFLHVERLTTISLPSANFEASAERNAPSSFLRGKV